MTVSSHADDEEHITPLDASSRRTTEGAVSRLFQAYTTNNTRWYEPGTDFCFYETAYQTCLASKDRLLKTLDPDELQDLRAAQGIETVLSQMNNVAEQIQKKGDKSITERRTADFVNGFCDFAVKASGIVMALLPQSPEYTVTFVVVTKKEREETLMTFLRSLVDRLPVVEFYQNIFPTYDMKLAVASIYIGMSKFLEDVLLYFRGGRLSKLSDAILRPKDGKLNEQIEDIERAIERLNTLKTAANVAQQSDMKHMLQDAGHVVARIHQNLEGTAVALGLLSRKVDAIQSDTEQLLEFRSVKNALSLRQIILTSASTSTSDDPDKEDLRSTQSKNFSLSPKDGWDGNGILEHLLAWSSSDHRTLLWVGGRSGNQDPWVTPFTLDMIKAFRTQEVVLLYALCNNTATTRFLTPNTLLRRLISQLLDHDPRLAFQNPRLFNKYIFQNATSFDRLWSIFVQLIELVREVFIVIDRIEEVRHDEDGYVQDMLIPELLKLASSEHFERQQGGCVGVIITSAQEAPADISGDRRLYEVWIDTGKRPKDRR